jgi:hypothetical protein
MNTHEADHLCLLALQAGRREVCPGGECPLWEDGECAVERLIAEAELCNDEWPEGDAADLASA